MRSPSSLALYGMLGVATLMLQAFAQTGTFSPIIAIPFGPGTAASPGAGTAATQATLPPAFTIMSAAPLPDRFAPGGIAPFGLRAMSLGGLGYAPAMGPDGLARVPAGLHWYVRQNALDTRR
jgi:hypothetical protein